MFILQADKNKLTLCPSSREPLTSGSVNVYRCRFGFSEDWDGLIKTACFRSGSQVVTVLLDDASECVIPWEVTDPDDKGKKLFAGVYGVQGSDVVLPTVWAELGEILPGVTYGAPSRPPTLGLYEQVLAILTGKQDKLRGKPGQVVGFDETGNTVPQDAPTGGSGAADHNVLTNRDTTDQHPIQAITGLESALQQIPKPMTAADLQNILYGGNEND
ncbi:MAG: hypothetical protein K2N78_12600 [Oscillospiraceae bacterium]|nr:hypothetical protein [Oscillospiraceae bacterium]